MWYRRLNRSTKILIWGATLLILAIICSSIWIILHERTSNAPSTNVGQTNTQKGEATIVDGAIVARKGTTDPVCKARFDPSVAAPQKWQDITWDGQNGPWEIATMKGVGPAALTKSGIPYCYPPTEAGAVLAAVNTIIVFDTPYRPIISQYIFTGPKKDEYVQRINALTQDQIDALAKDEAYIPVAYRAQALSPTHYQIHILGQIGVTADQVILIMELYYKDGDWRWEPNFEEDHIHVLNREEDYVATPDWKELRPDSLAQFRDGME